MPLKVQSGKTGKTYEMPWSLSTDPSDDEIDKFIQTQEASSSPIASVKPASGFDRFKNVAGGDPNARPNNFTDVKKHFFENLTKPGIPKFDTNDISLASESYPVRAGKELFNDFVSPASSPAAVASGAAVGKVAQVAKPYLAELSPVLSKLFGGTSSEAPIPPTEAPIPVKPVMDASGRSVAPPQVNLERPPGPWSANISNTPKISSQTSDDIYKNVTEKLGMGLPKEPLTKTQLANAAIIKENLAAKKMTSKVRAVSPNEVDLLNPDQTTVNEMMSKGYQPTGEVNPDNSLKMVKPVSQVGPSSTTPVAPVTPEGLDFKGGSTPRSFIEGTNGGNVPPNTPSTVNAVAPTPKPKQFGMVTQVGNNLKSATAGLDLSAPLRQGRAAMHRPEFYKALPDMFKSMASEDGYNKVISSITEHPNFESATKNGLSITKLGNDMTQREEHIMGSMVEKIPGIGRAYRASNRAYTGFLDKLRFDTYNSLMDDATKVSKDPEIGKQVADLVNVMTGRGKLGKFEGSAPLLNATFFSPRFLSSRVKLLTSPISYRNADPFVRKEAIKSLAALVTSQATLIGLASAAGMKHSFNPTNSDFGKFKAGNNRLDINAGLSQLVTLASRIAPDWVGGGKVQSSSTGKTSKLDTGKFGSFTRMGTLGRFAVNKESPLASLITELWTGHKATDDREKISAKESIIRHTTPMFAQDVVDTLSDDPKYAWLIGPALFGGSVQNYKAKPKANPLMR